MRRLLFILVRYIGLLKAAEKFKAKMFADAMSEVGKQLIEHLSIDLRTLSAEAKKKHVPVKDVSACGAFVIAL